MTARQPRPASTVTPYHDDGLAGHDERLAGLDERLT
jgi:hypothetical protein